MKHPVELAAQFIRRADYVLANDVLRDEYGAKLAHPAQIRYCSFDPEDIIGKALERTAHVFGCLTCTEDDIFLTVVGEKEAGIGKEQEDYIQGLLATSIWVGLDHLVRIHMFLASSMVLTARGVM